MLFCTLQFLVVLTVAPKYGLLARWLRLWKMVPQQTVEDILTTILRYGKPASLAIIRQYAESGKGLGKALRRMVRDGLLVERQGSYSLSDKGGREAAKVLRAHRLWEAYLARIGTPPEELHATAHHLEHLRGGETVDYLDEKLGRPAVDPHGRIIPEKKNSGAKGGAGL
jgi:manganese/iron transport system permease protein/iron/zinc/copper transport system permease protein